MPLGYGSFYASSASRVSTVSYRTAESKTRVRGDDAAGAGVGVGVGVVKSEAVTAGKGAGGGARRAGSVSSSMKAVRRSLELRQGPAYDHLVSLEALTREESTWWPKHWREKTQRKSLSSLSASASALPPSQTVRVELTCSQSVEEWAKVKAAAITRERTAEREQEMKHRANANARKEEAEKAWGKWVLRKEEEARAKAERSRKEREEAEKRKKEEEEAAEKQRVRDKRFYEEKRMARLREAQVRRGWRRGGEVKAM